MFHVKHFAIQLEIAVIQCDVCKALALLFIIFMNSTLDMKIEGKY